MCLEVQRMAYIRILEICWVFIVAVFMGVYVGMHNLHSLTIWGNFPFCVSLGKRLNFLNPPMEAERDQTFPITTHSQGAGHVTQSQCKDTSAWDLMNLGSVIQEMYSHRFSTGLIDGYSPPRGTDPDLASAASLPWVLLTSEASFSSFSIWETPNIFPVNCLSTQVNPRYFLLFATRNLYVGVSNLSCNTAP